MKPCALLFSMLLAGCAGHSSSREPAPKSVPSAPKMHAAGPAIAPTTAGNSQSKKVALGAISSMRDGAAVSIEGAFFYYPSTDEYHLCSTVLESNPPQCGGPSVTLRGVDAKAAASLLTGVDTLNQPPWVKWSMRSVTVTGTVAQGDIQVSSLK